MLLPNESLQADDSALHCSAVWHLFRLKGKGARLCIPLWERSMALAHESGRYRLSGRSGAAPYFGVTEAEVYCAAALLVESGWWNVLDENLGKPTVYHPLRHGKPDSVKGSWLETHPNQCCQKLVMPWSAEGDPLGPRLWAITGQTYYPNHLAGWRKRTGLTDDRIVERTKEFMESPACRFLGREHVLTGIPLRKALGEFLCAR